MNRKNKNEFNVIEVVESDASSNNTIFPDNTIIVFYDDTSKIKISDGKTPFNSLGTIGGGGGGATNLALGTRTTTTVPITNNNGTGVTLPVATTSLAGLLASADKTKLDGIATAATANSSDATLLARANHTGAQAISTVTNLQTSLDAKAALSSPTFTGTPTLPTGTIAVTQTSGNSSTAIATTAFVASSFISNSADTFGSKVLQIVSLTQAEYDGITPVATTFYVITG